MRCFVQCMISDAGSLCNYAASRHCWRMFEVLVNDVLNDFILYLVSKNPQSN